MGARGALCSNRLGLGSPLNCPTNPWGPAASQAPGHPTFRSRRLARRSRDCCRQISGADAGAWEWHLGTTKGPKSSPFVTDSPKVRKNGGFTGGKWWHLMILSEFNRILDDKMVSEFWDNLAPSECNLSCSCLFKRMTLFHFFPDVHFYSISVSHVCQLLRSTFQTWHVQCFSILKQ